MLVIYQTYEQFPEGFRPFLRTKSQAEVLSSHTNMHSTDAYRYANTYAYRHADTVGKDTDAYRYAYI